jgi:YbbR domain-containing protein
MTHGGGLLLTFVLVSVFWGLYAGRQLSVVSLTAPIYYRGIPADLQLKKASSEEVEVQVSGRRGLMSSLDPQQVRASLDLSRIRTGRHELFLESENIALPPGMEVERITPSSINIEVERILERTVEVRADLVGPPPEGLEVDTVRVKPDSVRVRGPAAILADMKSLLTEPIVLRNLPLREGQANQEVPLHIASPSIQLPALEQRQVQVTIRLRPEETPRAGTEVPTYRVREGDTLYEIGKRYGIPSERLRKLNSLKPGEYIHPGQELKIPPS